jgi:hypothetical protein
MRTKRRGPNAGKTCTFTGLALASLLGSAAASAQYPARGAGVWVGFGVGYGSANSFCDNCMSRSRTSGVTAFVQAGRVLSPSVRLGATLDGGLHTSGGTVEAVTTLAPVVKYYPFASKAFFVSASLGLSHYRANTSPALSGTGWGLILGVRDGLPVSRTVSLAPVASYAYGAVGDVTVTDGGAKFATGWKESVFRVGLGATWSR